MSINKPNLKAVIIHGNPIYVDTPPTIKFYKDIEAFLKHNGVSEVVHDPGADYTLPPEADFYIGHSRGAGRKKHMPKYRQDVFLKFGVPDGFIDPVDLKWCKEVYVKGTYQVPPKEHFNFIQSQKDAILFLIAKLNRTYQEPHSKMSRDGVFYDLNFFFRQTVDLPIQQIKINQIDWVLKHIPNITKDDKERIGRADVTVPILVSKYKNKELVVDGFHRLCKAISLGLKTLPYKRLSVQIFEDGRIDPALESMHIKSKLFTW